MLDNRLPIRPGKSRYEFVISDTRETVLAIFRTDDASSRSLVKSFAEEYVRKRQQEHPAEYFITLLDNNAVVDRRIQEKYWAGQKI